MFDEGLLHPLKTFLMDDGLPTVIYCNSLKRAALISQRQHKSAKLPGE